MSRIDSIDAVLEKNSDGVFDISFDSEGDITTNDFLDTAILMSIFCERRATPDEVPEPHRRRGWIGNESTPEFEIGSKVWLYEQARVTRTTINGLESEIFNGLEWMVEDSIAVELGPNDVTVSVNEDGVFAATIPAFRSNSKVGNAYFTLWENTGSYN